MPRVYIETSIVSYLRQRPSGQVVAAARQLLTHRWWNDHRHEYQLVTSQYVLDEAGLGEPSLAAERLQGLASIPLLDLPQKVTDLAAEILTRAILPSRARLDALHIAAAAFHEVDYLLTWNCKHIANVHVYANVRDLLIELGYRVPIFCTPEEMLGDDDEA
jgi:predicted nucleic acid-binding protein